MFRALQLDPHFSYARALLGHEHMINDHLEKAEEAFSRVVSEDPRSYSARFGLATIYLRKEQFPSAQKEIKRSIEVNPKNSMLYVYAAKCEHRSALSESISPCFVFPSFVFRIHECD